MQLICTYSQPFESKSSLVTHKNMNQVRLACLLSLPIFILRLLVRMHNAADELRKIIFFTLAFTLTSLCGLSCFFQTRPLSGQAHIYLNLVNGTMKRTLI